jgi:hypothetical protein
MRSAQLRCVTSAATGRDAKVDLRPLSQTCLARDSSSASTSRRSRLRPTSRSPLLVVLWGSARLCRSGVIRMLGSRTSGKSMLTEGGPVEWDFHKRDEEKLAHASGVVPQLPRAAIADDRDMPRACFTGQPKSRSSRSRCAPTAARTCEAPPLRWRSALGCGNRPDQRRGHGRDAWLLSWRSDSRDRRFDLGRGSVGLVLTPE